MGSIAKKILGVLVSVALTASFVPVVALGAPPTQEGLDGLVVPGDTTTGIDQATASTTVNIRGYEPDPAPDAFAILRLGPTVKIEAASDAQDKQVYVDIVNGSAAGKVDKSAYAVKWSRALGDASPEVLASTGDSDAAKAGRIDVRTLDASGNPIAADATPDADATTERVSYSLADDFFNNDKIYKYYVTIVDNAADDADKASGANVISTYDAGDASNCHPIEVTTGTVSSDYGYGPKVWPADVLPSGDPVWMVEGDNKPNDHESGEWNGVSGGVHKDTALDAMPMYTAGAQEDPAYQALLQSELATGRMIAGETTTDASGNPVAPGTTGATAQPGTAAWRVSLVDTRTGEGLDEVEPFVGDILVTLDLMPVLEELGLKDDSTASGLPADFPDAYELKHAGDSGVTMSDVVFEREDPNDETSPCTGKISFVLTGSGGVTPGMLGVFALTRTLNTNPDDPNHDQTFTVTTQVDASGGGRITPMDPVTYLVGAAPTYIFLPDDGYRVTGVKIFYDEEAVRTAAGAGATWATEDGKLRAAAGSILAGGTGSADSASGAPAKELASPIEVPGYAGTLANSLTFNSDLLGTDEAPVPWSVDAKLVVTFGRLADVSSETLNVFIGSKDSSLTDKVKDIRIADAFGNEQAIISVGQLGSGRTVALAANQAYEISFNLRQGFKIKGMTVAASATSDKPVVDTTPVSVVGNNYRIPKLIENLWFNVEFVENLQPEVVEYELSTEVTSGSDTGKAYFAGASADDMSVTTAMVTYGDGKTIMVAPTAGYKLASAQAFYVGADGVQTGSGDMMARYKAPESAETTGGGIGMLSFSTMTCKTIVRLAFVKVGGGSGGTDVPDKATVKVTDIKSASTGNSLVGYGATSNPELGVTVETAINSAKALAFYYNGTVDGKGGTGNYWAIQRLEVKHVKSGKVDVMGVSGGVNRAEVMVSDDIEVVAILRPWQAGDQTLGPNSEVTFTVGGEPLAGADGKPLGGRVVPGTTGTWEPGGSVKPSGTQSVAPGMSFVMTVEPAAAPGTSGSSTSELGENDPDYGKHWAIGQVVVDGVVVWPVENGTGGGSGSGSGLGGATVGESVADGRVPILGEGGKPFALYDATTGTYTLVGADGKPLVDASGNPTGEAFAFDPKAGVLTFDPVMGSHTVQAAFAMEDDEPGPGPSPENPDGPVVVPENPGVLVTPPGVTVDPDTGAVKVPVPGGGTVTLEPKPGTGAGTGNPPKYDQPKDPSDPSGNKPLTNPDNTQNVVDPSTGNVTEIQLPYVDADGNLVGKGGAYDPETGIWNAGGTVAGGAGGSGHVMAGRGDQVVTLRPSDTAEDTIHDWVIDEVMVDGVTVWPVAGAVASDGTVTMTGSDGTKVVYNPKTGAYVGTLPKGDTFGFELDSDGRTGELTFKSPKGEHQVQASFERAVDVGDKAEGVTVNVVTPNGQALTSGGFLWKPFKGGEAYRVVIAPEKGYRISAFTVCGEDRAAELARGADVTEDEYAELVAATGANSRSANGGQRSLLSSLFGVEDAYAAPLTVASNKGTANELEPRSEARSYTLDLKRDYYDTLVAQHAKEAAEGARAGSAKDEGIDIMVDFAKKDTGEFTVTAIVAGGEGTVNGARSVSIPVKAGGSTTLSLTPTKGYHVSALADSGVSGGTWQAYESGSYTVANVVSDRTVRVRFAPDVEGETYLVRARVGAGSGTVDGGQSVEVRVPKGGSYDFTFVPAAGWQVVRVTDSGANSGQPQQWTRNSYRVDNVTSDREVVVEFAMAGAAGSNTDAARTLRRITSMLRTGDDMLPFLFVALGVGLAAAGVAVLLAGNRRDESRRRDD